jgi:ABC-type Fe3+/spermidine/putrescine transport system ATPase subunit
VNRWAIEGLASRLEEFDLGPVDLALEPGSTVAILGASGAGKTTLLRTVAGFLPLRAGRLSRDGVDLTATPPERRGLGYVPQGLGLFPHRTVERNVGYPLELRGRTDAGAVSRRLLDRFGLGALAGRFPSRLSGGERQRVALARALASEPRLVLWDEPWQALDVEARHALSEVLEDLRTVERLPVIVVTHDPALAFSVADTFLVLRRGSVVFHGTPLALLERPIDPFTARFAGYENVLDRPTLAAAAGDPLGAWLGDRAGEGGIAFPRPSIASGPGRSGTWEGTVRSARPTPEGIAVAVACGSVPIAARIAGPIAAGVPAVGASVRFDVDDKSLRPLGPGGEA